MMENTSFAKIPHILNKSFSFTLGGALAWFGVLLAILVLGAHYFRAGNYLLAVCLVVIALLHCGKAPWKRLTVGAFLAWGAVEWAISVSSLITMRMFMGIPWLRGALILALVGLLTALASVHTLVKANRLLPAERPDIPFAKALSFILVFVALYAFHSRYPNLLILERFFPVWGGVEIAILAWYGAGVTGGLLSPASRKTRRTAWLIFSLVFFAQMALGLAGVQEMRMLGNAHIPVPGMIIFASVYRGEFGFMPFLVLGTILLTGSAWCGMLCYFGSLESALCLKKSVKKSSYFLSLAMRYGRLTSLVSGVLIAIILRFMEFPVTTAIGFGLGFAAISLIIMFYASWKYTGMAHCSIFCPLGLIINILGRLSPWRVKIDRNACDNCGTCEKVCGYRAIDVQSRQKGTASLRCVLCRDCIPVCHNSAISLTFPFVRPKFAELIFVVLLVLLHVLFIATARPL